jgi:hypothetical protein
MTQNDLAWEKLFRDHKIIDSINQYGEFTISSREINVYREARLMTKFDHYANLPALFQDNYLAILPISRGGYIIAKFDAYMKFENGDIPDIEYISFPENIQSIDFENITSEATAINCAYVSGIFEHFLEEEELLPTVSGRMGSGSFNFNINHLKNNNRVKIIVDGSQLEIDGGYEGVNSLSLIEAKNSISSDFLIRQLYYPFRLWNHRIEKKVSSIFLTYSNGIFHLYKYRFEDHHHYNSLTLVKQKRYSLESRDISVDDIQKILASTALIKEPKIPFPQADSFERLINLCELLYHKIELSKDNVTTNYDFDTRQTDYYTNAGRYLGLIDKKKDNGIHYCLTAEGGELFTLNYKNRQLRLIELILQHSVFAEALTLYLERAEPPTKDKIVELMKRANLYHIDTDITFNRRASTILGWINWILNVLENSYS